jgi:hypothetical protein
MIFNLSVYAAFILEWRTGRKVMSQPNYAALKGKTIFTAWRPVAVLEPKRIEMPYSLRLDHKNKTWNVL